MIHENIKQSSKQTEEKQLLLLNWVGHGKRNKRSILPTIVKTAQVLYGICDINCSWNSFLNLKKFREVGSNELKLQDKRIQIMYVYMYVKKKCIYQQLYMLIDQIVKVSTLFLYKKKGKIMVGQVRPSSLRFSDKIML